MRIVAGRIDAIAKGKTLTIVDIKTGAENDWHRIQLELYARLLTQTMARNGTVVRFPKLAAVYLSLSSENSYIRWHDRMEKEEYDKLLKKFPVENEVHLDGKPEEYQLIYEPDGHHYYLRKKKGQLTRVPGVSNTLEALKVKKKYKDTGEESPFARFGTRIHDWIEAAHRGEDVLKSLKELDDREAADVIERYLNNWQQILQRQELAVIANERAVWGQL